MESQKEPSQDQEGLAGDVMDSLGSPDELREPEKLPEPREEFKDKEGAQSQETLAVQKRLKAQRRAHEREVRELHARIGDLESRMTQPTTAQSHTGNSYSPEGGVDENIHKAVSYALQHRDMEERKAKEAQAQQHVQRRYQEFQKHLDGMGDKYDDFHDVVFGPETPFTTVMRDYAMTLPITGAGSAAEVLYKLGKNPEELKRIAVLHPIDQAREMANLSHMLISGMDSRNTQTKPPLGNIKTNPAINANANNMSPGNIRARMKAGTWK